MSQPRSPRDLVAVIPQPPQLSRMLTKHLRKCKSPQRLRLHKKLLNPTLQWKCQSATCVQSPPLQQSKQLDLRQKLSIWSQSS